jgi:hypothetical protein
MRMMLLVPAQMQKADPPLHFKTIVAEDMGNILLAIDSYGNWSLEVQDDGFSKMGLIKMNLGK